jgi:hypothetical protein
LTIVPDCVEDIPWIHIALEDDCFVSDGHLDVNPTCWTRIVVANVDSRANGTVANCEGVGMSLSPAGKESEIVFTGTDISVLCGDPFGNANGEDIFPLSNMAETGAPSHHTVNPGGVETFAIAEGPESPLLV